jgi:dTMP kinase
MEIVSNFIVFEGGDGSGTSTQCEIIKKKFDDVNIPCFCTFEPTDGPIGKMIRSALKKDLLIKPETLARLFAADRNEHLYQSGGIVEQCGKNHITVSDRYTPSSLVYQGIECGEELPVELNKDFPLPELLFYFDIDPETALKRIGKRNFRDSYEYLDFQIEVHRRYKKIISGYADLGVKVKIINASTPIETIAEEIWNAVQQLPIMQKVD